MYIYSIAYAAPQLLRICHEMPEVISKVKTWTTLSSWFLAKWTNSSNVPISYSEASWTGLLNVRNLSWDDAIMSYLPQIDKKTLPPLCDIDDAVIGSLSQEMRHKWPDLKETKIMLAIGDGAAANLGSGCFNYRNVALTIGTTAAVRVVVSEKELQGKRIPKGLWAYRIDKTRVLIGGALTNGGSVYQNFCRMHSIDGGSNETITKLAAIAPNAHGLTILPFLDGERAPGNVLCFL